MGAARLSIDKTLKPCAICGEPIPKPRNCSWKNYSKKKYCSKKCYNVVAGDIARKNGSVTKNRVTKTCVICGESFEVQASKQNRYSTCGKEECRHTYTVQRMRVNNRISNRPISIAKRSKTYEQRRIEVECGCGCGIKFKVTKGRLDQNVGGRIFYNREHYENWFRGENCIFWKGGEDDYYGPNWKIQRDLARKRDKVCQCCGATPEDVGQELDVHHIIPRRQFNGDYVKANDLSNLITLCHPCHMLAEWRGVEVARYIKLREKLQRGVLLQPPAS